MGIPDNLLHFAKIAARQAYLLLISPQATFLSGEPLFWLLGRRFKIPKFNLPIIKRVLILRLDDIGDAVLTSPLLRELRRNLPNAWITLVVNPTVYNLVEMCPHVNEILTYNPHTSGRRLGQLRQHWRALRLAWKHFGSRGYDLAIVPRWDVDYYDAAFLSYVSGADYRVGYVKEAKGTKKLRNWSLSTLYNLPITDNSVKHEVEHNLEIIRFLGGTIREEHLELWLGPEDKTFADSILKDHDVDINDILICFNPGASKANRMWALANYAELGNYLIKKYRAKIIVVGGKGEEPLAQELWRTLGDKMINVVGRATLRQSGALLKRCHIHIGNDSGPKHIAVAAGVPVIEISQHPRDGSPSHHNSPRRFGSWRVPNVVLQPQTGYDSCSDYCVSNQAHCILSVTVEEVKDAVRTLLSDKLYHENKLIT